MTEYKTDRDKLDHIEEIVGDLFALVPDSDRICDELMLIDSVCAAPLESEKF